MDALRIGFFVISAPRFYAGLGLLLLVLLAEFGAWRRRGSGLEGAADAAWAWNALFGVLLGARLGFVLQNFTYYRQEPWQAFAFWQGGFSPWWGVLVGAVVALVTLRRRERFGALLVPSVVALGPGCSCRRSSVRPAGSLPSRLVPSSGWRATFRPRGGGARTHRGQRWASWCIPCRRECRSSPERRRRTGRPRAVREPGRGPGRWEIPDAHPTVRRTMCC